MSLFLSKLISYLFVAQSAIGLLYFVFYSTLFHNDTLCTLCLRILIGFYYVFLGIILIARLNTDKNISKQIDLFIAFFVLTLYSLLYSPIISFREYSVIIFCATANFAIMIAAQIGYYSRAFSNIMKVLLFLYILLFIVLSIKMPQYSVTNSLTLGFNNPNETGAYFLLLISCSFISLYKHKSKSSKIILFCTAAILLYYLSLTKSRTSFFLSTSIFLYYILPINIKHEKIFLITCFLVPVFFYYFYQYLYNKDFFSDLTLLDRDFFTGRTSVFVDERVTFSMLGSFSVGGLNIYSSIINSFGLLGCFVISILYYLINTNIFINTPHGTISKKNIPLFCFCCLLIHGSTETAMFRGGACFPVLIGCSAFIFLSDLNIKNSAPVQEELQ